MKSLEHNYKVIIERGEDGYYVARVPELPGCVTQARTYEALQKRVREAIQLCCEVAALDPRYRKEIERNRGAGSFFAIEEVTVSA